MISNIKVINASEIPKEHFATKHFKNCSNKDNLVPISGTNPYIKGNHYEVCYVCHTCWRGQVIWFMLKKEVK